MTVESPSASDLDDAIFPVSAEVTVDHEVVSTPTLQALHSPASVIPSRQSPLSHAPAGAVVSTAPVEPNLPPQALPPPSATLPPTPSTLPSLHTQSLSPISDPQVPPTPLQKIARSPSASRFDVPASASPTNIPQCPKFQAVQLSSKSPPLDGAVQAPQNVPPSLARVHASGSAPVPVSSPSIQQNPKPPPRRQSSGLDFLQLDLQVAREKKQKAVVEAARSGSVTHVSSPTSSMSGRATPAAAIATSIPVAITGAPSTPALSLSSPTVPVVAHGTPALISPVPRTPPMNPPTAISSESGDLSALQPQKAQTAASRPVHRDLRQRSNRSGSGTPNTPRLQITDRAPAPPPEPGSLAAPIVIDEDEEVPISVPAEEKMEVDVPVEALPNVEAKSLTVIDSQGSRGDGESTERHPKPLPQQEEGVTSGHLAKQAPQSTSRVLVPGAEPPAASVPDVAVSAQKPSVPLTTGPFSPLPTSRITSALVPPVSTPGNEMQGVSSQQATESQEAHGENGGNDLLNADVDTLVVAEKKTTTASLARAGDGGRETMEISVEGGDYPSVVAVSGATIEQPSGSESTLDKVSSPTAVIVMAVPETRNTETTPFAPPATAPIAATAEASPTLVTSPDELMRVLLGMKSSELGSSMDAQVLALHSAPEDKKYSRPHLKPHSNPATGKHGDGASVADAPPASGKHRRSPTPDGDTRRVFPRTSSPTPIAERRQDLPTTPVLSNIAQLTTPTVTVSFVAQQRENEDGTGGVIGPSSSLGPSVYLEPLTRSGSGLASTNLSSTALRTNSSLSDMDISRSSISPPPIAVLKSLSEGASSSNSRSVSLASGRTEDDEMVDELAPLFGKDMRVLSMFKPYDIPGEFTLDFLLVDADWNKISLWVRAPENIECVSVTLPYAC